MEVTEDMLKDAKRRLPRAETFDFVRCCNCDFVGLIENSSPTCPTCERKGVLTWADDDNQEYSP